jgi:LPS sulfotransferase NodH
MLSSPRPTLSYTIWFSQRTGSTLLCRALEETGVAGRPGEHLMAVSLDALYARHGISDPRELRSRIWNMAATSNGVLGLKFSMFEPWFSTVVGTLAEVGGHDGTRPGIWENAFPNCRHVFMTRRNKVRLAVSWWKAIQSQEWHRTRGAQPRAGDIAERYSFDAIDHLLAEAAMRDAAIQEFFAEGRIAPLTVVYEDFIANYEKTVREVLGWLGLDSNAATLAAPAYERLSDGVSEEWVQRFRREKQAGWPNLGW